MRQFIQYLVAMFVICAALSSCKKYLEAKPDKTLIIPTKIEELQALLDTYDLRMNYFDGSGGEVSCDDYYLNDADYNSLAETWSRMYTWEKYNIYPVFSNDWSRAYDVVFIANTVLEQAGKVSASTEADRSHVIAQAHFFRARSFFQAVSAWSLVYNESTASSDLGIPLRLSSDFNQPSVRASVKDSYEQIISDLKAAIPALPVRPVTVLRPSKPAAYGMLARVYLSMGKYPEAGLYADSCLQLNSTLMNFNTLNASASFPVPEFNAEVLFKAKTPVPPPLSDSRAKIDSLLYRSYDINDLRKTIFFRNNNNGSYAFRGSYEGSASLFTGLAVNEVLLTRAECAARSGNVNAALNDLNTLLVKRWKTGTFVPVTAIDAADALSKILSERRKELVMTGLRWLDIKRLNREGAGIVLKRIVNGVMIQLPPGDLRYALALPDDLVTLSGLLQNPR